jgi:hypothetical protein
VALFDGLSDRERVDVLAAITERFCPHCGGRHPDHSSCQCENDE